MFAVVTSGFRLGCPLLLEECRSALDWWLAAGRTGNVKQVVLVP